MGKNIILNGNTYSGVSEVELPVSGGTALFKDEDEIVTPSGTKQITTNGTHDVSAYENANVNVPTGGEHDPEISVAASGLVTASCGGESTTHQLSSADDADFIAENIKEGINLFGVLGTLAGGSSAIITGESYLPNANVSKKIPIGKSVSRYVAVWCLNDTAMEAAKATTGKLIAGVSTHNVVIPSDLDAELYSGTLMDWCYGYSFSATDPLTIRGLNPVDVSGAGQDDENFVINTVYSAYDGSSKKYKWAVIDLSEVF